MRDLPIGNGTVLVNFDADYNICDVCFPHVGMENHTVGHAIRFGVWADGLMKWIWDGWHIEYLEKYLKLQTAAGQIPQLHKPGRSRPTCESEWHVWE